MPADVRVIDLDCPPFESQDHPGYPQPDETTLRHFVRSGWRLVNVVGRKAYLVRDGDGK